MPEAACCGGGSRTSSWRRLGGRRWRSGSSWSLPARIVEHAEGGWSALVCRLHRRFMHGAASWNRVHDVPATGGAVDRPAPRQAPRRRRFVAHRIEHASAATPMLIVGDAVRASAGRPASGRAAVQTLTPLRLISLGRCGAQRRQLKRAATSCCARVRYSTPGRLVAETGTPGQSFQRQRVAGRGPASLKPGARQLRAERRPQPRPARRRCSDCRRWLAKAGRVPLPALSRRRRRRRGGV